MKGISQPIDFIYILILFLLVAFVIIGTLIFTSKDLMEDIRSGKIHEKIEEFVKRVIGR